MPPRKPEKFAPVPSMMQLPRQSLSIVHGAPFGAPAVVTDPQPGKSPPYGSQTVGASQSGQSGRGLLSVMQLGTQ